MDTTEGMAVIAAKADMADMVGTIMATIIIIIITGIDQSTRIVDKIATKTELCV